MKIRIKTLATALCVASLMLATACKEKAAEQNETATEQKEAKAEMGPEYTSAYVCPMHCEGSGSDEAGNCPKCGMAYVANDDHKGDGHNH